MPDDLRIHHSPYTGEYLVVDKGWPRKIVHRAKTLKEAALFQHPNKGDQPMTENGTYPRDVWWYGYEIGTGIDAVLVVVMYQSDEQHENDKKDKFKYYVTDPYMADSREKAMDFFKEKLLMMKAKGGPQTWVNRSIKGI